MVRVAFLGETCYNLNLVLYAHDVKGGSGMQAVNRVKRLRRGLLWLSVAALVLGALPL